MLLNTISVVILICWILQGLYTAGRIRKEGYSPLWWIGTGVFALGLILPLVAIFV